MSPDRRARVAGPHVSKLTLTNFRNYGSLSLTLNPGLVVFTGDNGAGKTNLLEAISFLAPGRGLRRAPYAEVAREGGGDGFAVHAEVVGPAGEASIGTGTTGVPTDSELGRRVRINGATSRSAEALLEWLRVGWITPAMDSLFSGPAAERRRFLDRLVLAIDPAHGQRAIAYERAMRGRNRLLAEDQHDAAWFDAIEVQLAELGTAIAAARSELVRLLTAMIERLPADAPFPQATVALAGFPDDAIGLRPAVEVEEELRQRLAAGRTRDRAAGRTLDGPHRSDLLTGHRPKHMPAELCSTGEQKALLVGLMLSHARLTGDMTGAAPILLLDEIGAHLDAGRRAALFSILEDLGGQVFMTGTEATLFSALRGRAQFLQVAHGEVEPADGA